METETSGSATPCGDASAHLAGCCCLFFFSPARWTVTLTDADATDGRTGDGVNAYGAPRRRPPFDSRTHACPAEHGQHSPLLLKAKKVEEVNLVQ